MPDLDRVMAACQLLKSGGFEDIAALLAKLERAERRSERQPRAKKVQLVDASGRPRRGGQFYLKTDRNRVQLEESK